MAKFNSASEILLPGEISRNPKQTNNGLGDNRSDQDSGNGTRSSSDGSINKSNNNEVADKTGRDNPAFSTSSDGKVTDLQGNGTMFSRENSSVKQRTDLNHCNGTEHKSTMNGMEYHEMTANGQKKKLEEAEKQNVKPPLTGKDIFEIVSKLVACFLCGMVMGLALEKGRVFEPRSIRCQFTYQTWIMMKMFLSAVATGLLCLGALSILPFTKQSFENARQEYVSCLTTKGVLTATIGGMLLGAGMALSGACPGMVLAQVGAWVGGGSGLVTFVGCLTGAFVYGVCNPFFEKHLGRSAPYQKQLADDWISKLPFAFFAFSLCAVMAVIVVGLEFWKPWRTEILPSPAENFTTTWFMTDYAWPPYVAGILIGCLQIPLVLVVKDTIGGSSSYCTISSQVLVTKRMEAAIPYLAKFKRGVSSWWQVFFVLGVIFGAMLSSLISHTIAQTDGVGWAVSFIGGFVMLFGARVGGGCTSGHGLSGVGVLALVSFVAVASMFVGGTIVGVIGWGLEKGDVIKVFCPLNGSEGVSS